MLRINLRAMFGLGLALASQLSLGEAHYFVVVNKKMKETNLIKNESPDVAYIQAMNKYHQHLTNSLLSNGTESFVRTDEVFPLIQPVIEDVVPETCLPLASCKTNITYSLALIKVPEGKESDMAEIEKSIYAKKKAAEAQASNSREKELEKEVKTLKIQLKKVEAKSQDALKELNSKVTQERYNRKL